MDLYDSGRDGVLFMPVPAPASVLAGRHSYPVVRLGFKPSWCGQSALGRFDSCCLPPQGFIAVYSRKHPETPYVVGVGGACRSCALPDHTPESHYHLWVGLG